MDHGTYQTLPDPILAAHRELWRSILDNDKAGMERATAAFGINPEFAWILALMLTMSMNSSGLLEANGDRMTARGRQEMIDRFQKDENLRNMHQETFGTIPRELLLIFKTHNLLRFVNDQLGNPINRFRVMSSVAIRSINEQRVAGHPVGWTTAVTLRASEARYALLAWVRPVVTYAQLAYRVAVAFLFGRPLSTAFLDLPSAPAAKPAENVIVSM